MLQPHVLSLPWGRQALVLDSDMFHHRAAVRADLYNRHSVLPTLGLAVVEGPFS